MPTGMQHSTEATPVETPGPGPVPEPEEGEPSSSTAARDMLLGMDPYTLVHRCLREVMLYNPWDWI